MPPKAAHHSRWSLVVAKGQHVKEPEAKQLRDVMCWPQTEAQQGFFLSVMAQIHNQSNLCASLLVESYASAINKVSFRWHRLLAVEKPDGILWILLQ